MKNFVFTRYFLVALSALTLLAACDDDEHLLEGRVETFPVGQVTWSASVTSAEREVIADLIRSMVKVEACRFYMGAQIRSYKQPNYYYGYATVDTSYWVGPVREVAMPDFYIGRYEVTQAQWRAVMGTVLPTGRYTVVPNLERTAPWYAETGLGDDVAAYNLSHADAELFCQTLAAKTGLAFRLPTEAEWECAARGGRYSKGYKYVGSDDYREVAWCHDNTGVLSADNPNYGIHPVGQLKPNELGLYDMNGNVDEWVAGSYYRYTLADTTGAQGATTLGDTLILRGGSWNLPKSNTSARAFCPANRKKFIQSSYADNDSFQSAIAHCGLRLAL